MRNFSFGVRRVVLQSIMWKAARISAIGVISFLGSFVFAALILFLIPGSNPIRIQRFFIDVSNENDWPAQININPKNGFQSRYIVHALERRDISFEQLTQRSIGRPSFGPEAVIEVELRVLDQSVCIVDFSSDLGDLASGITTRAVADDCRWKAKKE